ncbi:Uncharacterized protein XB17_00075 [Leptospira santarosai]|nr:Uncharacterized protein XB17_00075 [Leptospira santarosai]
MNRLFVQIPTMFFIVSSARAVIMVKGKPKVILLNRLLEGISSLLYYTSEVFHNIGNS